MATGYLFIGFLFLINPDYFTFDILPDVFGYLLIARGLYRLSFLEDRIWQARRMTRTLAWVSLVKLVSNLIALTTNVESTRLTLMFVFAAAEGFLGTHDFAAVRSVGTNVRSTVRTVYYCRVARQGDLLELKVCANGFLYNMVRAITGTVLYAAEGKLQPEEIPEILASGNRTLAGPTAPPGGLYLTHVWYEDERLNG